jgi:hypothetical protein
MAVSRRMFLQRLGIGLGAAAVAPIIPFNDASTAAREGVVIGEYNVLDDPSTHQVVQLPNGEYQIRIESSALGEGVIREWIHREVTALNGRAF